MTEQQSPQCGGLLAAFAVGALVGAGVALLFAPRSGRETRELISRKTREFKARAEDALEDAKEVVRGKREQIMAAVEAGKEVMENEGGTTPS